MIDDAAQAQLDVTSTSEGAPAPSLVPMLSYSQLEDYDSCGEKYRLKRVLHVPETTSGAALAGRVMHECIAAGETNAIWTLSDADSDDAIMLLQLTFRERLRSEVDAATPPIRWGQRQHVLRDDENKIVRGRGGKALQTIEDEDWWGRECRVMFERLRLIRRQDEKRGWSMLEGGVELEVRAMLDSEHLLRGFVDAAMFVDEGGELIVRDYKTGSLLSLKEKQLWVYAWLLMQAREYRTARGQFVWLRGAKLETQIREVQIGELAEIVPRLFRDHVRGIEAGFFPLNPSSLCRSCSVRAHCVVGSKLVDEGDEG